MTAALPIVTPLVAALISLTAAGRPAAGRWLGPLGALANLAAALVVAAEVWGAGYAVLHVGGWPGPFGITLAVDLLGAAMLVVAGGIGLAGAVFAAREVSGPLLRRHFFAFFHLLLMGVNGAFVTGDLFNLYVWFEVLLMASFALLTLGGRPAQLEGGVKYFLLNLLGSTCFLLGAGLLYGLAGTLNLADLSARLATPEAAAAALPAGALLLVAFAAKTALFPVFAWLPPAYHTPGVAASAVFAGLLTKVGLYALIRLGTLVFPAAAPLWQPLLTAVAVLTMLTGVLGAAAHFHARKILGFHIVSQVGYMALGLALMTPAALAAAVYYTVHHIVVKANLFLIAGLIARRGGSEDLARAGGLYVRAPLLALLFFIPAFSLGGIPPLSGFWAKLALVQAGLAAEAWLAAGAALAIGLLTLYSMTKIWAEAFWKDHPGEPPGERRARLPAALWLPCAALALVTVALGLAGDPALAYAERTAAQLLDPAGYRAAVLPPTPATP